LVGFAPFSVNVTFSAFVVDETDQITLLVVKLSGSEKLSQPACQGWVMAKAGLEQTNDAKTAAGNARMLDSSSIDDCQERIVTAFRRRSDEPARRGLAATTISLFASTV
jgi:hypothetical protein